MLLLLLLLTLVHGFLPLSISFGVCTKQKSYIRLPVYVHSELSGVDRLFLGTRWCNAFHLLEQGLQLHLQLQRCSVRAKNFELPLIASDFGD